MNCLEVRELLSAYYDGELTQETRTLVAQHVESCPSCAEELSGFAQLSSMAKVLPHASPPAHLWTELEWQLAGTANATQNPLIGIWRRPAPRLVILATSLLAVIVLGWMIAHRNGQPHDDAFGTEFGKYLAEFRRSPVDAQQALVFRYKGKEVDAGEFIQQVGYRPAISRGLPTGYSVESTHVLDMPCCRCVQSLCKKSDGSMFAVFEHEDRQQHMFGDRPGVECACQGKQCRLVGLDDRLAASWNLGSRHITVIGIESLEEVNELVAWFGEPGA